MLDGKIGKKGVILAVLARSPSASCITRFIG
jgi:hypothetical protein